MTAKDFVTWAQGYYGNYPEGQKRDIWDYLKEKSPEYLDALKITLKMRFSSKWGHAPDVGIFEDKDIRREATDRMKYDKPALEDNRPMATPEEISEFMAAFKALEQKQAATV